MALIVLAGAVGLVLRSIDLRRVASEPRSIIDALTPVARVAPVRRVKPVTPPLPAEILAAGDAEPPSFAPSAAPLPERKILRAALPPAGASSPAAVARAKTPDRVTKAPLDGNRKAAGRRQLEADFPPAYGLGAGNLPRR